MSNHKNSVHRDPVAEGANGFGVVLGVLSAQLDDTACEIESAVTNVCQSFSSIAKRTKENAAQTARVAAGDSGPDGNVMVRARDTLASLLGRMDQVRRAAGESVETLRRIESIISRIDLIQNSLEEVDVFSHALRILAINARIEAARASERDRAFGVVASETSVLADNIRGMSKSIRGMVDSLCQEVKETTKRIRGGLIQAGLLNEQDSGGAARALDLSQEEGNRALDALTKAHTDMKKLVADSAKNSQQLAEDIGDAMTALQFQDAVSQQIGHVVAALNETRAALTAGDFGQAANLIKRLRNSSTMQSERHVLDRLTSNHAHTDEAGDDPTSIELF